MSSEQWLKIPNIPRGVDNCFSKLHITKILKQYDNSLIESSLHIKLVNSVFIMQWKHKTECPIRSVNKVVKPFSFPEVLSSNWCNFAKTYFYFSNFIYNCVANIIPLVVANYVKQTISLTLILILFPTQLRINISFQIQFRVDRVSGCTLENGKRN